MSIKEISMALLMPSSYTAPAELYECPNGAIATMLLFRVMSSSATSAVVSLHKLSPGATATLTQGNALLWNESVAAGGSIDKRVFFPATEGDRFYFTSNDTAVSVVATGMLRS